MAIQPILTSRLVNQQIATTAFSTPQQIVQWMGAMQAQDFAMAKWAVGLRSPGMYDADVEKAFNDGSIIRTHVLRPTWHFVHPADIRWMLALTAPRIHAINAYYYRKFELDAKIFNRCNGVFTKALQGGKQLSRATLAATLANNKIKADGVRLSCIMMHAELDGVLCSGPRDGKQFTYSLLEEWAPPAKAPTKQEALAALTTRYFTSRSPATMQDFAHWSGLAITDAKEGIAMLDGSILKEEIGGEEYWVATAAPGHTYTAASKIQTTFLMPDYDEYAISYINRSAILGDRKDTGNVKNDNPLFNHSLIVDGIAAGTWQRVVKGKAVSVEITLGKTLSKVKQAAVEKAVKRYLAFVNGGKVGMPAGF